jgi:hypothetical protein
MKKISNSKLAIISGGGSACAEAMGASVVVLALAFGFTTAPLAVAAGVATARAWATCYASGWK